MRRQSYADNKDKLNAQKREAYAKGEDKLETFRKKSNTVIFEDYEELMTHKHLRDVLTEMGIDPKNAQYRINRDSGLKGTGIFGHTSDDGKVIIIYPDAFQNKEQLVKTLGHEQIHLNQVRKNGKIKTHEELLMREKEARATEEGWWKSYVKTTGYRR